VSLSGRGDAEVARSLCTTVCLSVSERCGVARAKAFTGTHVVDSAGGVLGESLTCWGHHYGALCPDAWSLRVRTRSTARRATETPLASHPPWSRRLRRLASACGSMGGWMARVQQSWCARSMYRRQGAEGPWVLEVLSWHSCCSGDLSVGYVK
jgi:hypothetical protein